MVQRTQTATQVLFPFFRYKDAPAAIDWLTKAFGLEEQMVVPPARTERSRMPSSASAGP